MFRLYACNVQSHFYKASITNLMGSLDFCGVKVSFVVCFGFFFVFTEMLSIQVLRLHGSPMKADDWQRRMAWLSRSGGSNTDEFQDLILWDDAS